MRIIRFIFNPTVNNVFVYVLLVLISVIPLQLSFAGPKTTYAHSIFERVKLNLYVSKTAEGDVISLKEQSFIATAIRQAFLFGYTPTIYFQVEKPPFEFFQDKYGRPTFDENSLTIKIALSPHMYESEKQLITDYWNALQVNGKIQRISLELSQDFIPVVSPLKIPMGPEKAKLYLLSLMQKFSRYNNWKARSCSGIY